MKLDIKTIKPGDRVKFYDDQLEKMQIRNVKEVHRTLKRVVVRNFGKVQIVDGVNIINHYPLMSNKN